jgi:hypothetical protein
MKLVCILALSATCLVGPLSTETPSPVPTASSPTTRSLDRTPQELVALFALGLATPNPSLVSSPRCDYAGVCYPPPAQCAAAGCHWPTPTCLIADLFPQCYCACN